jgi:hypothetical protein
MFTVAAKPVEFAKGVLSGTIGGLDMLALANTIMIAVIKPKPPTRRTVRFERLNDFSV